MKNKIYQLKLKKNLIPGLQITCLMIFFLMTRATNAQVTLNLNLFIQGFYTGGGMMDNNGAGGFLYITGQSVNPADVDFVSIAAIDPNTFNPADEQQGILQTNGDVSVTFGPSVIEGFPYYIRVIHRSGVETWSAVPVPMNALTTYLFSTSPSMAYGDNQTPTSVQGVPDGFGFAIYNGDFNQDGAIDASDLLELDPDVQNGIGGYAGNDFNGDGAVDGLDIPLFICNIESGVAAFRP